MSNEKPSLFCSLPLYLKSYHPELHNLFEITCSTGALNAKHNGTTLIIPSDATIKEIRTLAFTSDLASVTKAAELLRAHVIKDARKTVAEWNERKANTPNAMFPSQHVALVGIDGSKVKLEGGAVIEIDKQFRDAGRPIAVWKIVSGVMPTKTAALAAKPVRKPAAKGSKAGSYEPEEGQRSTLRFQLGALVENTFLIRNIDVASISGSKPSNIYFETVMSLMYYLMNNQTYEDIYYGKVLPLFSCQNMDFYTFVQPHKYGGDYLISDVALTDWWTSNRENQPGTGEIMELVSASFSKIPAKFAECAVYKDRKTLVDCIEQIRGEISDDGDLRKIVDKVLEKYKEVESSNKVGSCDNVYPEPLIEYARANPGILAQIHELDFITACMFNQLSRDPSFDSQYYETIINIIGDYTHGKSNKHLLLDENKIKQLIAPSQYVSKILGFVKSCFFLHVAMPKNEFLNYEKVFGVKETAKPISSDMLDREEIYNAVKESWLKHRRIYGEALKANVGSVFAALKTADTGKLSETDKKAILDLARQITEKDNPVVGLYSNK